MCIMCVRCIALAAVCTAAFHCMLKESVGEVWASFNAFRTACKVSKKSREKK